MEIKFGKEYSNKFGLLGGEQYLFEFNNGFGASVIRHTGSIGHHKELWELAVLVTVNGGWELCYSTPITDNVRGNLTENEVADLLVKIKKLGEEKYV